MSQQSQHSRPMLELKSGVPSGGTPKTTPHLLPCRIHHDGSVEPVESFWEPKNSTDGTSTAYFRGRKLEGKTVKVPEGYRGVVAVTPVGEEQPGRPDEGEVDVIDVDALLPTSSMQVRAGFDHLVVWTHGTADAASTDPHTKGIDEWISLAEKIHSYDTPAAKV
ncbi:hypothetical protein MFIFM68171_06954 [Madurella fahalii]|uniref:Uncharacterized protein n=1 Tax=Madurella fahalii TaxID=1157608 RepID=A0ABQ0GG83_9PEZI